LELLQQKISILEKHLGDYTLSRVNNLKHEQDVIAQQQDDLWKEMEKIPQQWAEEKLLDLHLQKNQALLQQIGSMIESKNIAGHIDVTLSAPLDKALVPLQPVSPRFFWYVLMGALSGAFLTFCGLLVKSVATGIRVTADNLELMGLHVTGTLSSQSMDSHVKAISDSDLSTLRSLSAYLCPAEMRPWAQYPFGHSLVLLVGNGPDYSLEFAELLAKRGLKVLLLQISFDKAAIVAEQPGLLQYIQGEAELPKINKGKTYDTISVGGISRYGNELVESDRFKTLLETLEQQYDWVIAVSSAQVTGAEATSLLTVFNRVGVTVNEEFLHDLKPYFKVTRAGGKKVSFVISAS